MIHRLIYVVMAIMLLTTAGQVQAESIGGSHQTISITTRDSSIIEASLYLPVDTTREKFPLVVLLHMLGHNRGSYNDFVPQLLDQNWAVLNVDLRGHGKSVMVRKKIRTAKSLSAADFMMMPGDLMLLLEHVGTEIPRLDTTQIAVIGASIGSSVGTRYAARSPNVNALVLLSPGLRYQGLTTDGPLADYYKRPVLILVGNQDDYSYASAVKLEKVAHGPAKFIEFDSGKHGTDLFEGNLGADTLIVNWLATYLE